MGDMTLDRTNATSVETILKDELARETRALSGVAPVISHMLDGAGHSLVSDAIVARLRGMLNALASELLRGGDAAVSTNMLANTDIDALVDALMQDSALLGHFYALAMEGHLAERLEHKAGIDPALSPLLQELIASDRPAVAELAMMTLAAQSRFLQSQRRMQHSLAELPSDLFVRALVAFETALPETAAKKSAAIKGRFDEGTSRLGLLARLISAMKGGAVAALELEHAGLGLFVSALSAYTNQPRDHAILSCHERQSARLALGLRAAGLDQDAINRQFALVGPEQFAHDHLAAVSQERAMELLQAEQAGRAE